MLRHHLSGGHTLDQVKVVETDKTFNSVVHFRRALASAGEATAFELEHVLVPRASPGPGGDESADRLAPCDKRRESAAVAQSNDDHAIAVYEVVLAHGRVSGLEALDFAAEIGF